MFYIVWIITAFAAVGAGCWLASQIDKKSKLEKPISQNKNK